MPRCAVLLLCEIVEALFLIAVTHEKTCSDTHGMELTYPLRRQNLLLRTDRDDMLGRNFGLIRLLRYSVP